MAFSLDDKQRRILPRWRDSRHLSAGELATPHRAGEHAGPDLYDRSLFEDLRHDWVSQGTLLHASEFIGAALVNGRLDDAREAAEFVLREAPLGAPVRRLASRVFGNVRDEAAPTSSPVATAQARAGFLKKRVREDPRNSLAWVDLAREYAVLGQTAQAVRSMRIATDLAPGNRFVLRAACTLYVHVGDPDQAIYLLRSAPTLQADSWLMAAEIAASESAARRSTCLKAGHRLVASKKLPALQTSELASALATEEMLSGANKAAKKLFSVALYDPTENAVAQAEWASSSLSGLTVDAKHLAVPHSFEARARDARGRANWKQALEESWRWLLDQPFSSEPAVLGSYVAGVALNDHKEAVRIARSGLIANPQDALLKNNLAVSLAVSGNVEEACRVFESIRGDVADLGYRATVLATAGLLSYRHGSLERGRALYEQALVMLTGHRFDRLRAVAALHLAREELVAQGERAHEFLRRARELASSSAAPEVEAFRGIVDKLAADRQVFA